MKVAIVTDWLTNMGGAERVVLEMHKMFPQAPIYTSLYDKKRMPLFEGADVRPSWINKIPLARKKHQLFTMPRQWYFSRLKLDQYDLVLSASGAEAKAVKTGPKTLHINYCHSPTHYYWVRPDEYLANPGFGRFDPVMRVGLKFLLKRARVWDYLVAQRPDVVIANSTITKDRIKKYYDRKSEIVHPPVSLDRFKWQGEERSYYVTLGRQVHYMRKDLAVIACTRLNLPLKVIGNGPEHQKLRSLAGSTVDFITGASDEDVARYLAQAKGFIFPGEEDFGITAVEAMAAGTPVIAYRGGGALDTVEEGKTGIFFDKQNVRALTKALKEFEDFEPNHNAIKAHAKKFSAEKFKQNLKSVIDQAVKEHQSN